MINKNKTGRKLPHDKNFCSMGIEQTDFCTGRQGYDFAKNHAELIYIHVLVASTPTTKL